MGEVSFGKFRLIAELGHGGMADVFLAVVAGPLGSGFSKLTVVKRLRENLADEPEFVEMLVDEARISGRLNHPNVVQTNEVGSVDGQYFISMEYLDGQPLHRIQHRATQRAAKLLAAAEPGVTPPDPFPKECQYLVIVDALAGLHHAHELADYDGTSLEVVHRDVTPHNIFVTYEGQTKVVDFGIAKAVGRASETRQGVVKGKVRYMAPEQATGTRVDRRADIFSVGVMLWEAVTGRRLWKDMDDLAIVQALVNGNVKASPREVDPTVPEELDRICRKALAEASSRYTTAEEFRSDLESYLADAGLLLKARRKLAASVSELFADKRSEIKAIIDRQLQQLKARQAAETSAAQSEPLLGVPRAATSSARFSTAPGSLSGAPTALNAFPPPQEQAPSLASSYDQAHSATNASTMSGAASELGAPQPMPAYIAPRTAFTFARVVTLMAVAVLVFAGVGFVTTRVKLRRVAAAESADVHLKLMTVPANASVSLDGVPVATPNDTRFPRDGREHQVRVEAAGFEPHVESLRLDNDLAMSVVLTNVPAPKPTPTLAASASGKPANSPKQAPAPGSSAAVRTVASPSH